MNWMQHHALSVYLSSLSRVASPVALATSPSRRWLRSPVSRGTDDAVDPTVARVHRCLSVRPAHRGVCVGAMAGLTPPPQVTGARLMQRKVKERQTHKTKKQMRSHQTAVSSTRKMFRWKSLTSGSSSWNPNVCSAVVLSLWKILISKTFFFFKVTADVSAFR